MYVQWTMLLIAAAVQLTPVRADYPERPIRVLVPFAAGGGSDTFARVIKAGIEQQNLLSQPLVIVNVPGAGATIGSRRAKNAAADGYTVLLLHDALITARYWGTVEYGPEAFAAVAGTGRSGMVIAVREDSPFRSLRELLEAARQRPGTITCAANLGAISHFVYLQLEQQLPGARLRYTQSGGGAHRFSAVAGGHVETTAFSVAEYVRFQPAGMRALAYLGETRHPQMPNVPTAAEQQLYVTRSVIQYWWMPRDTPPERVEAFAAVLRAALQTPYVQGRLAEMHIDPVFLDREQLVRHVRRAEEEMAAVDPRRQVPLPDIPLAVLIATLASGACLVVGGLRPRATRDHGTRQVVDAHGQLRAITCLVLCVVYAVLLTTGVVSLGWVTAAFVLAAGAALGGVGWRRLLAVSVAAAALGVTFSLVFGRLFVIDVAS